MQDNREALRLELRQIIQTDRMASDIIQDAKDMRKSIANRSEKEKAIIIAAAKAHREELEKRAEDEQAKELMNRKLEATKSFARQKEEIGQKVQTGRSDWVKKITQNIVEA